MIRPLNLKQIHINAFKTLISKILSAKIGRFF